jgi:hypothetical protein
MSKSRATFCSASAISGEAGAAALGLADVARPAAMGFERVDAQPDELHAAALEFRLDPGQ